MKLKLIMFVSTNMILNVYLYNAIAEKSGLSLSFSRDIIERICICIVKCTNINKTLILQNILFKNHYEDTTRII